MGYSILGMIVFSVFFDLKSHFYIFFLSFSCLIKWFFIEDLSFILPIPGMIVSFVILDLKSHFYIFFFHFLT